MRTIREEEMDVTEYRDFADAYGQLGRFLDEVYNRKRIHSASGIPDPSRVRAAVAPGAESPAMHRPGTESDGRSPAFR